MYLPKKKNFRTATYAIKNIVNKNNQKISKQIPLHQLKKT